MSQELLIQPSTWCKLSSGISFVHWKLSTVQYQIFYTKPCTLYTLPLPGKNSSLEMRQRTSGRWENLLAAPAWARRSFMDHQHNVKGVGLKQEALNVNEKRRNLPVSWAAPKQIRISWDWTERCAVNCCLSEVNHCEGKIWGEGWSHLELLQRVPLMQNMASVKGIKLSLIAWQRKESNKKGEMGLLEVEQQ